MDNNGYNSDEDEMYPNPDSYQQQRQRQLRQQLQQQLQEQSSFRTSSSYVSMISDSDRNITDEAFVDEEDEEDDDDRNQNENLSELQPININRHVFYTEDFYSKNNLKLSKLKFSKISNSSKNKFNNINNKRRSIINNRKYSSFDNSNNSDESNNNENNNLSFIDSIKCVSKSLLPAQQSPNHQISKTTNSIFVIWLQTLFPICYWLPNYNFKTDLLNDIIAGCTILALHIPQGLAYARLAGVEPINGLYVSLFPVIIYAIFGTSRQVSIGTFAVISIACRDALESFELNQIAVLNLSTNITTDNGTIETTTMQPNPDLPNAIDILTALCVFVGLLQLILGMLQLGIMAIILSGTLISAFVTACSIHVFTSQIFALIDVESRGEEVLEEPIPFDIIKSWIRFIVRIPKANMTTTLLSISCISILIFVKYFLTPWLMKRFELKKVIIPIDILVIVFSTLISAMMDLNDKYDVKIIPEIPKAFEDIPKVPDFSLITRLYPSVILITIVTYVSTYSLGKMYAKQHGYEVSANQELIALGAANAISAFFQCYPCSGSLARSAVMDKVGARTQLASIVSSLLMVVFLLYLSSYLHTLPKAVLSCIIVVALYSTMKNIKEVKTAWHASKLDGILWMGTFIFVLLFGVGHGLLYSVIFSFFILIIRLSIPIVKLKRQVKNSELFVEVEHIYDTYDPLTGGNRFQQQQPQQQSNNNLFDIKWIVFEFQGPLLFINSIILKNKFNKLIGRYLVHQQKPMKNINEIYNNNNNMDNKSIKNHQKMNKKKSKKDDEKTEKNGKNQSFKVTFDFDQIPTSLSSPLSHPFIHLIIFDCTRLTYIDTKGVETLLEIINSCEEFGSKMVLASCSQIVYDSLERNNFFQKFNPRHCYMSVMDAIVDNNKTLATIL